LGTDSNGLAFTSAGMLILKNNSLGMRISQFQQYSFSNMYASASGLTPSNPVKRLLMQDNQVRENTLI
jgi:hypothetical protein